MAVRAKWDQYRRVAFEAAHPRERAG